MGHRYGYACINTRLQREGVQTSRGMIRRTFDARGVPYASELAVKNAADLLSILRWNALNGIRVFRITSCLVPWASEFELESMPDYEEFKGLLAQCGKVAVETSQRLSFHPGPFNCLSSDSERVIQNSIRDLRMHGELADLLGLPRSRWSKINIHLGGRHGDGARAIDNFARSVERLPESVRTRLTVENDDRPNLFSTRDLMEAHRLTGVPIVHDFHHHQFCDGGWSQEEALDAAMSTWPTGIRPVVHYSESARSEGRQDALPNAHSDYILGPIPFPDRDIDVVIEAKAKEDALFRYCGKLSAAGPGALVMRNADRVSVWIEEHGLLKWAGVWSDDSVAVLLRPFEVRSSYTALGSAVAEFTPLLLGGRVLWARSCDLEGADGVS